MDEFDYFLQQAAGRRRKLSACPTELSGSLPCIADLQDKKETGFEFDRRTPALTILNNQSVGKRKPSGLLDVPGMNQDGLVGVGLRRSRSDSGVSGQEVGLLCSPCSPTLGRKIRSMKNVWSSLKDIMVPDTRPKSPSRSKSPDCRAGGLRRVESSPKMNVVVPAGGGMLDITQHKDSGLRRTKSARTRRSIKKKLTRQESELTSLDSTQVAISAMPLMKAQVSTVRRSSSVKLRPNKLNKSRGNGLGRSASVKIPRKSCIGPDEARRGTVNSDDAVIRQRQYRPKQLLRDRTLSVCGADGPDGPDMVRVRNFDITRKGVINRGDSFLSRSTSATSLGSSDDSLELSRKKSVESDDGDVFSEDDLYKVMILGAPGVGKTTLMKQFHTSECVQARYATQASLDSDQISEVDSLVVPVSIGDRNMEKFIRFIDFPTDEHWERQTDVDGYMVVYDCTSRETFHRAIDLLYSIKQDSAIQKTLIVVANKADLVRTREVSSQEGSSIAETYKCKYIEVSAWMNLSVDDLLVGVLNQIQAQKGGRKIDGRKSPLIMIFDKIMHRQRTSSSRSCENLLA